MGGIAFGLGTIGRGIGDRYGDKLRRDIENQRNRALNETAVRVSSRTVGPSSAQKQQREEAIRAQEQAAKDLKDRQDQAKLDAENNRTMAEKDRYFQESGQRIRQQDAIDRQQSALGQPDPVMAHYAGNEERVHVAAANNDPMEAAKAAIKQGSVIEDLFKKGDETRALQALQASQALGIPDASGLQYANVGGNRVLVATKGGQPYRTKNGNLAVVYAPGGKTYSPDDDADFISDLAKADPDNSGAKVPELMQQFALAREKAGPGVAPIQLFEQIQSGTVGQPREGDVAQQTLRGTRVSREKPTFKIGDTDLSGKLLGRMVEKDIETVSKRFDIPRSVAKSLQSVLRGDPSDRTVARELIPWVSKLKISRKEKDALLKELAKRVLEAGLKPQQQQQQQRQQQQRQPLPQVPRPQAAPASSGISGFLTPQQAMQLGRNAFYRNR